MYITPMKLHIISAVALAAALGACTDLDEKVYDQVSSENFYNSRADVIRSVVFPFESAYWNIIPRQLINELPADQVICPARDGWYDDGGQWRRYHYHEYNTDVVAWEIANMWTNSYQNISKCNFVCEKLDQLNPEKFSFTTAEFNNFKAQCHVLRAWCYLNLLDCFRNVPLVVSYSHQEENTTTQVEPQRLFQFIESELLDCLPMLAKKEALGSQAQYQGLWTQAGAAALLVRLYLNAEIYIGQPCYDKCAKVAQDILDGQYGAYAVADRWDAPFDWDNNNCDEVIFGFPGDGGYSYWHYNDGTFWSTTPPNANLYFGDVKAKAGYHNCHFGVAPSYDPTGQLYNYSLGMPTQKFAKYPGDYRMLKYRNLGNGRREGMFLYGYLEYTDQGGTTKRLQSPESPYDIYLRDAVGDFKKLAPDQWCNDAKSDMNGNDFNSGWFFVKYPFYSDDDPHQLEADYTEIRLPEVIYSLAECKLRAGDRNGAAQLLNSVRRRNYPDSDLAKALYAPEGTAQLDEQEMLDEWGREFFFEGRRRIDLIRFHRFTTGQWWDKTPDVDDHTVIFPIMRSILSTNPDLKQNPGYNS